ncbi:MAG: type II CRISPR-associated endonuclease Cas1 [Lentisphaeria bacterium]|nr:type II CRISPR-associated endonuclease Cas1 [Lentisphaeria bacterium]
MTDRIIEISDTAAGLTLENGLLKASFPDRPQVTVPVAEIQCLILANPAIRISGALLAALAENKAVVLISGPNRMPAAMQFPLSGNYLQTERFHAQIDAPKPLSKRLWQTIVKAKIVRQADLLMECRQQDFGLYSLPAKVLSGDPQNVEARAAAIYWKHLFNRPFTRDRSAPDSNLLLNYGYAVLRAMTARACCAAGLHPTLGVNHHNRYDPFCLADDLMEPFRPVVDRAVRNLNPDNLEIAGLPAAARREILSALLGKVPASAGRWDLTDLLRISAEQTAKSFQTGEIALEY